ncbi:MAG: AsmA family protein [Terracidiphilus sp.]|jgi:hypothetical protein
MTDDAEGRHRNRRRLWLVAAMVVAILAVLIVPPLVSINRYKSRITHLMAASLGRPVRLSSVNLRLLPWPAFVLTDLTVEEDPAYGAEPILHANSVTASFRLLSLWRGKIEIGSVSLDEASLNLVRSGEGRWNLDSLFLTAAAHAGPAENGGRGAVPLPYLEATNSRINVKKGAEKLPFSLVSTDISFWQQEPGIWRIRVRGQPARTDLSLDLADTGLVRLEARVSRAPELRLMPMHVDLEWREAQLGQLARLVIGSDPGWRGDLTGELHLDGTPDASTVKTRLRATGVHRAEFAPAAPMDFDAQCGFNYHYSTRTLDNLICDSPLGDGRIHLAGDLPGKGGHPQFSVELDGVAVAAGLDALRTVRSGFGPGLEAGGAISGKIAYAEGSAENNSLPEPPQRAVRTKSHSTKPVPASGGPFTGSLTVDNLQLSGDALSAPLRLPKVVLQPVAAGAGQPAALAATVAIPAGGAMPLTVNARVAPSGYKLTIHGQASLARAREMAHVAGLPNAALLDSLAGDPISVDLSADGPWLSSQTTPFRSTSSPAGANQPPAVPQAADQALDQRAEPLTDRLSGVVTLRHASWKTGFLASPVEISTAALHLGGADNRWDPIVFTYGPVTGTARLSLPAGCEAAQPCPPHFDVEFGDLDAGTLQAAILGARERGTLLSTLLDRLRPSSAPVWPQLEGTIEAESLILGPVTLSEPSATLRILPAGAEITGLDAGLLGGRMHGEGTLQTGDKPAYSLKGTFEKLNPTAVGQLLNLRWSGGDFDADGQVDLSGFTGADLAASAKGTLHFEWRRGVVAASPGPASLILPIGRFDRWTADAEIANGAVTLKQNQLRQGARKRALQGAVTFAAPPKAATAAPRAAQPRRR